MQKVVCIEKDSLPVTCATASTKMILADEMPFQPDALLLSGYWQDIEKANPSYKIVIPAIIIFRPGEILIRQVGRYTTLWFGYVITPNHITPCDDMLQLACRGLGKKIKAKEQLTLLGYCMYPEGRIWNQFLIVYAARIQKKKRKSGERWQSLNQIHTIYFSLDPLSKRIYDTLYEDENLRKIWLVSEKHKKTVDN